jgi:hypothetical protein
MIVKNSRAQRRHDRARLKKKRQFHWGYGHIDKWAGRTPDVAGNINYMPARIAGSVVNTPTPCSCEMCRNLRKSAWNDSPLTIQERKAESAYIDGVEEYEVRDYWYWYWWDEEDYFLDFYGDNPADDWYLRWMYIKE